MNLKNIYLKHELNTKINCELNVAVFVLALISQNGCCKNSLLVDYSITGSIEKKKPEKILIINLMFEHNLMFEFQAKRRAIIYLFLFFFFCLWEF